MREEKLEELKANFSFLYDGGELKKYKQLTAEWVKALGSAMPKPTQPGHPQSSISKVDNGENPQCSDSSATKSINTLDTSVRRGKDVVHISRKRMGHGVSETRESQILSRIMDKVECELESQRKNSPFFDGAEEILVPNFTTSEVDILAAKELGHGEFCQIFEVMKFNVPESCHICFLHRGYNDPDPSPDRTSQQASIGSNTLGSVTDFVKSAEDHPSNNSSKCEKYVSKQTDTTESPVLKKHERNQSTDNPKLISCFSFSFDANISDYDELEDDHEDDEYDRETRGFMKDHCLRNGEVRSFRRKFEPHCKWKILHEIFLFYLGSICSETHPK